MAGFVQLQGPPFHYEVALAELVDSGSPASEPIEQLLLALSG